MRHFNLKKLNDSGAVLISVVITLPFLMLIAFNYTRLSINNINVAQNDQFRTKAQLTADAGIDFALQQINQVPNWTGTGSEITFDTTGNVKTTYEITVTDVSDDKKIISTTAKVYRPATSTTPKASVRIDTELRPVTSGDFSIVTGVGGLTMENSAKVLGGSVHVNGNVIMKNTAQIGLALSPVTLTVAHHSCPVPADATYPRLCAPSENGQPITLQNSAHIYGDVSANNQVSTAGMTDDGLVASSGVDFQDLPAHDRPAQKASVAVTRTGADASCTTNNGTKTWAANTKIVGDVEISKKCDVTIKGDVWITGDFNMLNSGRLIVDNALGDTKPNIMVDGDRTYFRNTSEFVSNADGTGPQVISYYAVAACNPDCTDATITGAELEASRNFVGIELDNGASGPQTIFYARWSTVQISNSGAIGALIGQKVALKNSGTITFGTTVNTGTSYWVIDGYRRVFE